MSVEQGQGCVLCTLQSVAASASMCVTWLDPLADALPCTSDCVRGDSITWEQRELPAGRDQLSMGQAGKFQAHTKGVSQGFSKAMT